MLKTFQKRDLMVRLFLGFVVGIIGFMMVVTLVPGPVGSLAESPDAVADVGGRRVSMADVQRQLQRIERTQRIPGALRAFYARQVVDQLIFTRLLELEGERLGLRVSDEERAERIKAIVPTAFEGDKFAGMERYSAEVEGRLGITVSEFEELIGQSLLEEKFRRLVTDGITVAPEEVEQEFRRRNEKVKIEYVVVKPEELQAEVAASEAALAAHFEKNKAGYQVPERRSARYVLLDLNELRARASVPEADLRAYYQQHLDRYRVQNRSRVSHILFKTVGKTDAEAEEIGMKAEDILKKARKPGASFEDLAKQFSEDTTKTAGGDLGWIVQGQTVAEFEQAAFTLPKGTVSNLVKTQYGFHIIKVADRETARTKPFEEVRAEILPILSAEKAERTASEEADKLARAVRESSRKPIEEIARQFKLSVGETPAIAQGEPAGELGRAQDLVESLFRLRPGDLGGPLRTDRGFVVFTVKDTQPAHQGTLAEVRDRVTTDYRREQATGLAKSRAEELSRRAQAGEKLAQVAKSFNLEAKTSEPFARTGSVPEVGSASQIPAAFSMPPGATSTPLFLGARWAVFTVASQEAAKPEDLVRQFNELQSSVLSTKRQLAYEAFKDALEKRLRDEGRLDINQDNLKRLTTPS